MEFLAKYSKDFILLTKYPKDKCQHDGKINQGNKIIKAHAIACLKDSHKYQILLSKFNFQPFNKKIDTIFNNIYEHLTITEICKTSLFYSFFYVIVLLIYKKKNTNFKT